MIDYREDARWTVYVHIVPKELSGYDHPKYYVGITGMKPEYRWSNGNGYKEQYFYRAIQKYKWENIEHEIVASNLTEEEALAFEIKLINKLNTNDSKYGYNISGGGFGSKGLKGEKNPLYGKSLSEETKKKLSEAVKGKKMSEESKEKISVAMSDLWKNEEYRKMRHENHMKNPPKKEDHHMYNRRGFDNPSSKPVVCLNTLEVFGSAMEAARIKELCNSAISSCCRGERGKKHGKDENGNWLFWTYYSDYLKENNLTDDEARKSLFFIADKKEG